MALPLDPPTVGKLVVVKQLYRQAVSHAIGPYNRTRALLAVITFDLATETILKTLLAALTPTGKVDLNFPELVRECDKQLRQSQNTSLPYPSQIAQVHQVRNGAQHHATYPSETTVNDCRTHTTDFLEELVLVSWGRPFAEISLAQAIGDNSIKTYLLDAEAALANQDYRTAVEKAAIGLDAALNRVRGPVSGRPLYSKELVVSNSGTGKPVPDRAVSDAFAKMQGQLLYAVLGMDFHNYMRSLLISGVVIWATNGQARVHSLRENITADDAQFIVMYATETVAQIESRVGSFDQPFGTSYWW